MLFWWPCNHLLSNCISYNRFITPIIVPRFRHLCSMGLFWYWSRLWQEVVGLLIHFHGFLLLNLDTLWIGLSEKKKKKQRVKFKTRSYQHVLAASNIHNRLGSWWRFSVSVRHSRGSQFSFYQLHKYTSTKIFQGWLASKLTGDGPWQNSLVVSLKEASILLE